MTNDAPVKDMWQEHKNNLYQTFHEQTIVQY